MAGVVQVAVVAPEPPDTLPQLVIPSADCCHWIVPVFPAKDSVVVIPEHTDEAAAVAVPPIDEVPPVVIPDIQTQKPPVDNPYPSYPRNIGGPSIIIQPGPPRLIEGTNQY